MKLWLLGAVLVVGDVGKLALGGEPVPKACAEGKALYEQAEQLRAGGKFLEAVEAAAKVGSAASCVQWFVRFRGLMASVYTFDLKDSMKALAAANEVLSIDPGQSSFWFTLGYAQYQAGQNLEAILSFQQVIRYSAGSSPTAETLTQAYFLSAVCADRRLTEAGQRGPAQEHSELLRDAVIGWQEFRDFCMDFNCGADTLQKADERLLALQGMTREATEP